MLHRLRYHKNLHSPHIQLEPCGVCTFHLTFIDLLVAIVSYSLLVCWSCLLVLVGFGFGMVQSYAGPTLAIAIVVYCWVIFWFHLVCWVVVDVYLR